MENKLKDKLRQITQLEGNRNTVSRANKHSKKSLGHLNKGKKHAETFGFLKGEHDKDIRTAKKLAKEVEQLEKQHRADGEKLKAREAKMHATVEKIKAKKRADKEGSDAPQVFRQFSPREYKTASKQLQKDIDAAK